MTFMSRMFATALVAVSLTAPVSVQAEVIDLPRATLVVSNAEGQQIGSYDLFDFELKEDARALKRVVGDEQEPDRVLNFFVRDDKLQIVGGIGFKSDPFIQYAFGVSNFTGAPLNFMFLFSTVYVGGPYDSLTASVSSSATDGGQTPNGAVNINPFTAESIVDGTTYLTLTTPCALVGTPGFSSGCPSDADATNLISLATGALSVKLNFTVSARDLVSINGRTDLTREVAEPATLALLGAGLLGLAAIRRRVSV